MPSEWPETKQRQTKEPIKWASHLFTCKKSRQQSGLGKCQDVSRIGKHAANTTSVTLVACLRANKWPRPTATHFTVGAAFIYLFILFFTRISIASTMEAGQPTLRRIYLPARISRLNPVPLHQFNWRRTRKKYHQLHSNLTHTSDPSLSLSSNQGGIFIFGNMWIIQQIN